MKLKPYVSIDLEFTTLDIENSQILEIGAVYDDGVSDIKDLKTFQSVIYYNKFWEPSLDALVTNAKLLKELRDLPRDVKDGLTPAAVLAQFWVWLVSLQDQNAGKLVVAGKNAAGADIPILKKNCEMNHVSDITKLFSHRTLDAGSVYLDVFGENVTLGKINEITGRSAEVSHRALDDAFDVVYAIRHKMKMV